MKLVLILSLFLVSCAGLDFAPDEFGVEYGMGDGSIDSNTHYNRSFDTEGDWVAFNLTWYLGRSVAERELDRQAALVTRLLEAALTSDPHTTPSVVPMPPEPEKKAEPEKKEEAAPLPSNVQEILWYGAGSLLMVIVALIKRKWLAETTRKCRKALRSAPSEE